MTTTERPFSTATALTAHDGGRYTAELGTRFTIGGKAHGGLLMVLLAKAGLARLASELGREVDPVVVSTEFLRAPELGTVDLDTEVVKLGRQASIATVRMAQAGRLVLSATVTGGALPDADPRWLVPTEMPAEPPADAREAVPDVRTPGEGLAAATEARYDAGTMAFLRGETGDPQIRGWMRPRGEDPDPLFALLAGDALPPTLFNLGGDFGWAPTVQLTALLRAHPAPGWLRLESRSEMVAGTWFDEDCTVRDSRGMIVCQARQLALAPLPRG
ncbi:thioesterase family protein [Pseudonocardia sp. WMMC193]|uniref:thioesterase family protein n=1 Tax=Pseudonocardia sp. WMMC193 TaxID=2911965 RepID=UPI001F346CAE|nr:thioesterase family protein [Pseudonocardia sp. WMMC193]MCF7552922.1 thioesterase family protein [Pseudonocardia sp. WMMC193]